MSFDVDNVNSDAQVDIVNNGVPTMATAYSRSIIVTGGNTGLGFQCARFIGADPDILVVIGCRDTRAGNEAKAKLQLLGVTAAVLQLDLASLDSVRAFVTCFREGGFPPLSGLVCNAGSQNVGPPQRAAGGLEMTFAVNHLGHFLLANLLLPDMARDGRITFVTSSTHDPAAKTGMPAPKFENANAVAHDFQPGSDAGKRRYTTSKLCNLYCAYELTRRLEDSADSRLRSIRVNAFDPGLMPGTGLARTYPAPLRLVWNYILPALTLFYPNVHSVATSGRRLAELASVIDTATGHYVSDGRAIKSSALSYDTEKARDLWETSAAMAAIDSVPAGRSGGIGSFPDAVVLTA